MEKVQINLATKCKSYKPNNCNIYFKGLNFTDNAKNFCKDGVKLHGEQNQKTFKMNSV